MIAFAIITKNIELKSNKVIYENNQAHFNFYKMKNNYFLKNKQKIMIISN